MFVKPMHQNIKTTLVHSTYKKRQTTDWKLHIL